MKKLGLGIQELSKFRRDNLIYVDKTALVRKLVQDGTYYFFSRPRRFGKSLLVNTLQELFSGKRELFEDCRIAGQWNWEQRHPVIKLSFAEMSYRTQGLEKALERALEEQAARHGIRLQSPVYDQQFLELIRTLGGETPAVVLIDEYDKPIIDYLEQSAFQQARKNREILKTLYSGVKDQDKYLRFFFITGVSKFSKVSMFSDLNHLTDITLHGDFALLTGYTEEEIRTYYGEYLEAAAERLKLSQAVLFEKIKEWYNGYSWDGEHFVCNPYSVLSFFYEKAFKNYWFETGTPEFLISRLKATGQRLHRSVSKLVDESAFNKYDIDHLNTTAILFQTGYLTIKEADYTENRYRLDFPNREVRDAFLHFAAEQYTDSSSDEMEHITDVLRNAFEHKEIQATFTVLQALFSSIAVRQLDKVKSYEGFYHSIIYIVLKILGVRIQCEVQSNFGSTDAVIQTERYIYIVEFKVGSARSAIDQIRARRYYGPYLADTREVLLVGFGLNTGKRNLEEFIVEELEKP